METRHCADLDKEIYILLKDGYRLDMITPADSPREVQLSKNEEIVRLVSSRDQSSQESPEGGTHNAWIQGRAGMMYRDLIPSRLGGKLVASHIRLNEGGPVLDYVHYHNVDFQLIYCLRGRIKVVYEDQGPPFWLEPGDCVLQPPEIRHRVLECEAGSEVLELSSPAEHETWVEHELELPNDVIDRERDFSGQRFVCDHVPANGDVEADNRVPFRRTGIWEATNGFANVTIYKLHYDGGLHIRIDDKTICFLYVLSGTLFESTSLRPIVASEAKAFFNKRDILLSSAETTEFFQVLLNFP